MGDSHRDPGDAFRDVLTAARAGDMDALGRLMDRYRPYLLKLANEELDPAVRTKLGASDVVQETMLAAQRLLAEFEGEEERQLKAWLRAVLRNDLKDARKRFRDVAKRNLRREVGLEPTTGADSSVQPGMQVQQPGPTPRTQAAIDEETLRLNAAIARLPEDYQLILRLRNWEDLAFADIAKRMERSAEACRKIHSRAFAALQKELRRNGE